ncbi:MAG: tRNA lysidine(34) synthetase TilS [Clostridiales bacterium]|nr:tRNA lysidine(34) synthetase TilS [Clostridiales bacterium]
MEGFWKLCREEALLPPRGGKVLTAVSGGTDSMCLLSLLLEAGERYGFTVEAAHFDHHIRETSRRDCAFVEGWCQAHSVPLHIGGADIPALAVADGRGIEETARNYRYAFLRETAEQCGAQRIATAHNAEDNGETVLLHLLRGSGLNGLGGIAPRRGDLVRPLLTTSRKEIEAYNAAHGIPHVEDETNRDTAYTRNFLRQEVFPLLETCWPNAAETLGRSAATLQVDNAYLEGQAAALTAQAAAVPGGYAIPVATLINAPLALSNRALQQLAAKAAPEVVLTASQRSQILQLCRSGRLSGFVPLPGGLTARRVYDRLELTVEADELFLPVPLAVPGVTDTPRWRVVCTMEPCPNGKFNQPHSFYLKIGEYTLRPRQTGDAITLPARSRKTVKKLLIDSKIPQRERDFLPVFLAGEQVAALCSFGADCAFLPQPGEPAIHIVTERRG